MSVCVSVCVCVCVSGCMLVLGRLVCVMGCQSKISQHSYDRPYRLHDVRLQHGQRGKHAFAHSGCTLLIMYSVMYPLAGYGVRIAKYMPFTD